MEMGCSWGDGEGGEGMRRERGIERRRGGVGLILGEVR